MRLPLSRPVHEVLAEMFGVAPRPSPLVLIVNDPVPICLIGYLTASVRNNGVSALPSRSLLDKAIGSGGIPALKLADGEQRKGAKRPRGGVSISVSSLWLVTSCDGL